MNLRPDQQIIMNDVIEQMNYYRSLLVVSPTGSGKTVMFSWLTKKLSDEGKRILILAHRGELLDQISRTLMQFDVQHGVISPHHTREHHIPVQVGSVFSVLRRLRHLSEPHLIIVDEAHHAIQGSTWGKVLAYWQCPILGVTATPERLDGSGLHQYFESLTIGPSTATLIQAGLLSPYRAYSPPMKFSQKVPIRMGDYAVNVLEQEMTRTNLVGRIVDHYVRLANQKRALVFCVNIRHAQYVAEKFREAGYQSKHIDGTMSRFERESIIHDFRHGKIPVLTSCNLVSEGFDLPAIEVAILARPTKSLALYLQQVGRALRPFPGKDHALILDHAGNIPEHGLPDDEREWSLQGRERAAKKSSITSQSLKLCERCFAANRPGATVCTECGFVLLVKEPPRETHEQLELVTQQNIVRKERRRQVAMAKTLEDLKAIAKERGYSPRWAYVVWNIRRKNPKHARS